MEHTKNTHYLVHHYKECDHDDAKVIHGIKYDEWTKTYQFSRACVVFSPCDSNGIPKESDSDEGQYRNLKKFVHQQECEDEAGDSSHNIITISFHISPFLKTYNCFLNQWQEMTYDTKRDCYKTKLEDTLAEWIKNKDERNERYVLTLDGECDENCIHGIVYNPDTQKYILPKCLKAHILEMEEWKDLDDDDDYKKLQLKISDKTEYVYFDSDAIPTFNFWLFNPTKLKTATLHNIRDDERIGVLESEKEELIKNFHAAIQRIKQELSTLKKIQPGVKWVGLTSRRRLGGLAIKQRLNHELRSLE